MMRPRSDDGEGEPGVDPGLGVALDDLDVLRDIDGTPAEVAANRGVAAASLGSQSLRVPKRG